MRSMFALVASVLIVACAAEDPTRLTRSMETYGAQFDEGGDVGEPADLPLDPVDDTPDPAAPASPAPPTTQAPPTQPAPTQPPPAQPGPTQPPPAPTQPIKMETTADLNLRSGPATTHAVLLVMPAGSTVDVLVATPTTGFLNVRFAGTTGWASTKYLAAASTTAPSPTSGGVDGPPSPDSAIARARASVGFSYWWGGGAWLGGGPSASTKGSCSGNCPSCSHAGRYGADCSGMVGKAWQFGVKDLATNSHPYSTASFINDVAGKWSTVSRGALRRGDAMVYNTGGAGHVVLWEKGDGWGASTVYECKGCSYGCVHNTRTFSSSYKGIRRAGF